MSTPAGSAPDTAAASPARSRRWSGAWLVTLLPAACCGLPLLLGLAGSTAIAGWALGGIVGVLLLGAAAVFAAIHLRRRRAGAVCRPYRAPTGGAPAP